MWNFSFKNTDNNEAITLEDVKSTFYITKEGDFTRAGLDSVDEIRIYKGAENKINMVQSHSKKFQCTYLLHDFPFDTQVFFFQNLSVFIFLTKVCYVHMILEDFDQDIINLIPDNLKMDSPLELSQYQIEKWQLIYYDKGFKHI